MYTSIGMRNVCACVYIDARAGLTGRSDCDDHIAWLLKQRKFEEAVASAHANATCARQTSAHIGAGTDFGPPPLAGTDFAQVPSAAQPRERRREVPRAPDGERPLQGGARTVPPQMWAGFTGVVHEVRACVGGFQVHCASSATVAAGVSFSAQSAASAASFGSLEFKQTVP